MKEPFEPNASIWEAAATAPLVTPVVAIPMDALLRHAYGPFLLLIAVGPVATIVAIIVGYLGMFLICVPLYALLRRARRLSAIRLCVHTTMLGAALWVWLLQLNGSVTIDALAANAIEGATCSFAVAASFCWLAGLPWRAHRRVEETAA